MNKVEFGELIRVQKRTAERLHRTQHTVYIIPVKMRIGNVWLSETKIPFEHDFNEFVNEYEYYHCNYNETGNYSAFYTYKSNIK
jgi:hypothetical protein